MLPPKTNNLLITVHGIMSDNTGFVNLASYCQPLIPNFYHWPIYYKYTTPFQVLSRDQREFLFEMIQVKLIVVAQQIKIQLVGKERESYPAITIVAHSLGTMGMLRALEVGLANLQIKNFVLLGSILRRNVNFSGYASLGILVDAPLNIARPFDPYVRYGKAIKGGSSGTRGFIKVAPFSPNDTFKGGGHTAYDPDDFADIANLMMGNASRLVSFDSFRASLGFWRKSGLSLSRMIGRG